MTDVTRSFSVLSYTVTVTLPQETYDADTNPAAPAASIEWFIGVDYVCAPHPLLDPTYADHFRRERAAALASIASEVGYRFAVGEIIVCENQTAHVPGVWPPAGWDALPGRPPGWPT